MQYEQTKLLKRDAFNKLTFSVALLLRCRA